MRTIQPGKRHNTLKTVLIWALLMIPASALLYGTSTRVREVEKDLASTSAAMQQEADRARVLRAEWSYLNNPKQLASRAGKHLALSKAASPTQIASLRTVQEKVAYRMAAPEQNINAALAIAPATAQPLSTKVLAKPIAYQQSGLASLHDGSDSTHIPAAATWSQKIVSAFGGADLFSGHRAR